MAELDEQNTQGTDEGEQDLDFTTTLGDREITLKSPGSGALAMFSAAYARKSGAKQLAGMLDFFVARVDNDEDRDYVMEAMLEDEISLEDVMDTMESAMERWSEDPTSDTSASSSPSRTTGKRSTGASRRATKR